MTRTHRQDLDGSIVRDGKQVQAYLERSDPWDHAIPYDRHKYLKELQFREYNLTYFKYF